MAPEGADEAAPVLNLTPEERHVYGQLFRQADTDNAGIVVGEVAVKFFENTRLDSRTLGEIWQIADKENRGFLTPAGFGVALRLIGHAQAGHEPQMSRALQPGPLPRFEGISIAPLPIAANTTGSGGARPLSAQGTGSGVPQLVAQGTGAGSSRVPPLTLEKASQYALLFSDQARGETLLSGDKAKRIFELSGLSIETLGRIWQLADTEQRGALVQTEFIIAMHLLTSTKLGTLRTLPNVLPAGLYEAATRGAASAALGGASLGSGAAPQSPVARQQSPLGAGGASSSGIAPLPPLQRPLAGASRPSAGGNDWLITPAEKERVIPVFAALDQGKKGYITGEEAVPFLMRSGLSEDILAQIWDLADVTSEGRLTSDTFAVALHLIRMQRQRRDGTNILPAKLPANLVPPSLRNQLPPSSPPAAVQPPLPQQKAVPPPPPPPHHHKSAMDDLFGLDSAASSVPSLPAMTATPSDSGATAPATAAVPPASPADPFRPSSPTRSPTGTSFKPFIPSSSFGRSLTAQVTGDSNSSAPSSSFAKPAPAAPPAAAATASAAGAQNDLLGGDNDEASRNLSSDTAELANLSNQIGSLSKHVQDTTAHRSTLQTELSQTTTQKKNFEQRLAQLRTLYEKEARDVRALEDQLKTSRTETKKLQTELAALEASYQQLQTQHQQVTTSLQADQQENNSLKERLRAVTAEVNQLKPQIEKLKSEARQQKGIVAINRKQLSLGESERDKLKTEAEDLTRQNQDLARQIHEASVSSANSSAASPSVASTSGKNPFFRRTGSADVLGVFSPSPAPDRTASPASISAHTPAGQSFDDVFGPAHTAPSVTTPAAQPTEPPALAEVKPQFTGASSGSSSFSAVTAPTSETATASPSTIHQATPTAAPDVPSPPSESGNRQIGSGSTPFSGSTEASAGETAATTTPSTTEAPSSSPAPAHAEAVATATKVVDEDAPATSSSVFNHPNTATSAALAAATAGVAATVAATTGADSWGTHTADADNKEKAVWTSGHEQNDSLGDPFSALDQNQTPDKAKEDFESAFASFKAARAGEPASSGSSAVGAGGGSASGQPAATTTGPVTAADNKATAVHPDATKALANFNTEFPPIAELGRDDESDSESEGGGFEDDFAPASPKANAEHKASAAGASPAGVAAPAGPSTFASGVSTPAHDATVERGGAEMSGVTAPSAAHAPPTDMDDIFSSAATPAAATGAAATTPATATSAPAAASSAADTGFDDLDDFEGLEDAREGSGDEDFANISRSGLDDFQSGFDSSPVGQGGSRASFGVDSGFDFSGLGSTSTATAGAASGNGDATQNGADWFSFATGGSAPKAAESAAAPAPASSAAAPAAAAVPAVEDNTKDDPILQKLTNMGYTRSVALSALEKYDYNLDRAANYLANQS